MVITFSKKKIAEKLGFKSIDFSELYFPKYSFRYVSPGGNSSIIQYGSIIITPLKILWLNYNNRL